MTDFIQLTCPGCGRMFRLDASHESDKANCPHCRNEVVVPLTNSRNDDPFADLFDLEDESETLNQNENASSGTTGKQSTSQPHEVDSASNEVFEIVEDDDDLLNVKENKAERPTTQSEKSIASKRAESEKDDPSLDLENDDLLLGVESESQNKPIAKNDDDPYRVDELSSIKIEGVSLSTKPEGTFSFDCPVCDSLLYALPSQVGQSIRCEDCHSSVPVKLPEKHRKAGTETTENESPDKDEMFRGEELRLLDDSEESADVSNSSSDSNVDNLISDVAIETAREKEARRENARFGTGFGETINPADDGYQLKPLDESDEFTDASLEVEENLEIIPDDDEENPETDDTNKAQTSPSNTVEIDESDEPIDLLAEDMQKQPFKESTDQSRNDGVEIEQNKTENDSDVESEPSQNQVQAESSSTGYSGQSGAKFVPHGTKKKEAEAAKQADIDTVNAETVNEAIQKTTPVFNDPATWSLIGISAVMLSFAYLVCYLGAVALPENDESVGAYSIIMLLFGSCLLTAAFAGISALAYPVLDATHGFKKSIGSASDIDFKGLIFKAHYFGVSFAAALIPGVIFGLGFYALFGYLAFLPFCATISVFAFAPFFYVCANFHESPIQLFSPRIVATIQSKKLLWSSYYTCFAACGLLVMMGFALCIFAQQAALVLIVAPIHAVAFFAMIKGTANLSTMVNLSIRRKKNDESH